MSQTTFECYICHDEFIVDGEIPELKPDERLLCEDCFIMFGTYERLEVFNDE